MNYLEVEPREILSIKEYGRKKLKRFNIKKPRIIWLEEVFFKEIFINMSRRFWFFFFPNYVDNWEIKNDFISIYSDEEIDLTDYVTFKGLFKRDGIVVALKI